MKIRPGWHRRSQDGLDSAVHRLCGVAGGDGRCDGRGDGRCDGAKCVVSCVAAEENEGDGWDARRAAQREAGERRKGAQGQEVGSSQVTRDRWSVEQGRPWRQGLAGWEAAVLQVSGAAELPGWFGCRGGRKGGVRKKRKRGRGRGRGSGSGSRRRRKDQTKSKERETVTITTHTWDVAAMQDGSGKVERTGGQAGRRAGGRAREAGGPRGLQQGRTARRWRQVHKRSTSSREPQTGCGDPLRPWLAAGATRLPGWALSRLSHGCHWCKVPQRPAQDPLEPLRSLFSFYSLPGKPLPSLGSRLSLGAAVREGAGLYFGRYGQDCFYVAAQVPRSVGGG